MVEGGFTGASDVDVLVVLGDGVDLGEAYVRIALRLEEVLGWEALLVDSHLASRSRAGVPPYSWWLKRSVSVCLD